jgi:hypothetical protein
MRKLPTITMDDWTAALAEIGMQPLSNDPAAKTTAELAEMWGCEISTARVRIMRLLKIGRVQKCQKVIACQDGRHYPAPAYRLLPAKGTR